METRSISPRRRRTTADDTWASLLPDLLLNIFRRLYTTDLTRCFCTCKPWRRAIIGFATSNLLRPRPDRFVPDLLLGVFHFYGAVHYYKHAPLRRVPGPLVHSALPSPTTTTAPCYEYDADAAYTFLPAATSSTITGGGSKRASSYGEVLSSRDGFVLLIDTMRRAEGLCLCNLITGACTFLPVAGVEKCKYVLVTAHDHDLTGDDDPAAVTILATAGTDTYTMDDFFTYQLFSSPSSGDAASGTWGPVQRSGQLNNKGYESYMDYVVVCRGGAVHWLAGPAESSRYRRRVTCTVAVDVRTGRAWTTELPTQSNFYYDGNRSLLLATSGAGELSVIRSLPEHRIEVWVLVGGEGGEWTLRRTIDDVPSLLPHCMEKDDMGLNRVFLNAFCPRSGCVIGVLSDQQEVRIEVESSSGGSWSRRPVVEIIGDRQSYYCYPYEMDWSMYISKMKYY